MSQRIRSGNDADLDRGIRAVFVNVRQHITDHAAIVCLGQQVSSGFLPMQIAATFPAARASATHRRDAKGVLRRRIILDFGGLEDSR